MKRVLLSAAVAASVGLSGCATNPAYDHQLAGAADVAQHRAQSGPIARPECLPAARDFLFPQQLEPALADSGWRPLFLDYLYVSFTNAAAFSPTDTMPLSRWAKMLMLVQSAISLALAVMVVARAVNILG